MTALLTLEEIKAHLRVDHDADDEMLMDKVRQATAVLLAYIQGSRDKVIREDGELIPGEALTRMKGAAMRLTGMLYRNPDLAEREELPVCQDTGMACVFVELGQEVHIQGDFEQAVHEGVRRGYGEGYLRKSIVGDPLRRVNTGDNTPAAITLRLVPGEGCTITVAPKGFGSENMSRLGMLKPADGVEGVKKFVLDTVRQAGPNPCPPIVLGIGIGGSFDHCAALAKKALLRPLDEPNADPYYAALEKELLDAINATGFGPQGFGGATTCLGVAIEQKPTHVACLPVAVNVSCHVTRRASAEV